MKKALLGVLALTSVASFADVTGYVKSNSEVEAKTDVKKENDNVEFEKQEFPAKTKLDLGFFLDSNKDTFLFTGTRFSGQVQEAGVHNESYAGVRFDSKLNENTSLILNAVAGYTDEDKFNNDDKSIENALKEHLDAKKVWTADKKAELEKKDKEGDKNNFYKDNGFRLTENDRVLLSAVVKKNTESSNLLAGAIYNLDKNLNNRLESFVKAGKQLDGFRLDAELTHILGKDKELVTTSDPEALNLLTETDINNLNYGGRVKGNVKVSTKLANDTLELYSKPSFDLGTVLERESIKENVESERYFKAGIENGAKYTGLKNTTVEAKLVYDAEVAHLPIKDKMIYTYTPDSTKPAESYKYKENAGSLLNMPKAVLNVKYDNNKLLLETKNDTKFFATVELGESTYGANDEANEKAVFNAVEFNTKNKIGYKLTDNLSANIMGDYKLLKRFDFDDTKHDLLTGAGVSYDKGDLKFELNGRYNLFVEKYTNADSEEKLDLTHKVYANSKFTNTIKSGNLMLTPSLNTFVVSNVNKEDITFGLRPELKTKYMINSFELTNQLGFKYLLVHSIYEDKSSTPTKLVPMNLNSYGALANFGVNYIINENHKLGLGLDSDYSFGLNNKFFDTFENGVDKLVHNFDGEKAKDFATYVKDAKKDIDEETAKSVISDEVYRTHFFNLTPKVNAELKFGNVTVKPEISSKFTFAKDYNKDSSDKTPFELKKISGKGTLNIEYRW